MLILSACFLVGCGNDYGLKKKQIIGVKIEGKTSPLIGKFHSVNDEVLIIRLMQKGKLEYLGPKYIISRSKILYLYDPSVSVIKELR